MTHPPKSRSVRIASAGTNVFRDAARKQYRAKCYRVLSATNLLTPSPRDLITEADAQALIDDGVKVTILPSTAKQ